MTYFGNELEVTLDTKLDRVKRPGFENIWYFDTDRGLPKVKDPCDKDFEKQAEFSAKININAINRSAAESGKLEDLARQKVNINSYVIIHICLNNFSSSRSYT